MRQDFLALWGPVGLYMALIFGLSSISQFPDVPGTGFEHADKIVHLLLYGGLSALIVRARAGGWTKRTTAGVAVSAVIIATLYGVSDEIHQHFVPFRQTDARDLAADAVGAALAAGLLYLGIIRRRHEL